MQVCFFIDTRTAQGVLLIINLLVNEFKLLGVGFQLGGIVFLGNYFMLFRELFGRNNFATVILSDFLFFGSCFYVCLFNYVVLVALHEIGGKYLFDFQLQGYLIYFRLGI